MTNWFFYFLIAYWTLFTVGSAFIAYRNFRDMNK